MNINGLLSLLAYLHLLRKKYWLVGSPDFLVVYVFAFYKLP
jgi:hypothetical protein